MTTNPTQASAQTTPTAAAPRLDLYAPIHKALRHCMTDTLLRIGRLDTGDAAAMAAGLAQLEALLLMCEQHLAHENDFVHPAIEARQPGGARRIAGEHVEHLAHIAALRGDIGQLQQAGADRRMALALRLYRHLALFVADNFQHMHIEETAHNAALWAHYDDEELAALHGRLLASLPPQQTLQTMRWMVPALSPAERIGLFNGLKAEAPPEAFLGVVAHVRPYLDDAAWARLAPAIGLAQQPGLVDCR